MRTGIVTLLLLCCLVYAIETEHGMYFGDVSPEGKPDGHGTMYYKNNDVYTGGWFDGKKHGDDCNFFRFVFNADLQKKDLVEMYIGSYRDDLKNGPGSADYYDGKGKKKSYIGAWKDDLRHGKGVLINFDGGKYDGDWLNGKMTGQCIYTWSNGNNYIGRILNGKRHGFGTLIHVEGGKYEGNWENGLKNGQGTMYYANGPIYEGNWVNGLHHGHGKLSNPETRTEYIGQFVLDKKEGSGTFTEYDEHDKKITYEGEFHDNYFWEGKAILSPSDAFYETQDWHEGRLQLQTRNYYHDGYITKQKWENGNRVGQLEVTDPRGKTELMDDTLFQLTSFFR